MAGGQDDRGLGGGRKASANGRSKGSNGEDSPRRSRPRAPQHRPSTAPVQRLSQQLAAIKFPVLPPIAGQVLAAPGGSSGVAASVSVTDAAAAATASPLTVYSRPTATTTNTTATAPTAAAAAAPAPPVYVPPGSQQDMVYGKSRRRVLPAAPVPAPPPPRDAQAQHSSSGAPITTAAPTSSVRRASRVSVVTKAKVSSTGATPLKARAISARTFYAQPEAERHAIPEQCIAPPTAEPGEPVPEPDTRTPIRIAIRLTTGARIQAEFMPSDETARLYEFATAHVVLSQEWVLVTATVPRKVVSRLDQVRLQDVGLVRNELLHVETIL
eukprot:m.47593 g.47593  ORF g.47593 m.47593 type:complete len:327 (-) comp11933_c0_seq1:462-1442(-)